MIEFLALLAVLLPVAVIVAFGVLQDRRTRELARRVARVERDRAQAGEVLAAGLRRLDDIESMRPRASGALAQPDGEREALAELGRRVDEMARRADQLRAEQAYEHTMTGRRQRLPHIPARIYLTDSSRAGEVREAVLAAADAVGFEVAHEYAPVRGSFFQWTLLRLKGPEPGRPVRRVTDLGDDIRRVLSEPAAYGGGARLPELALQAGPSVIQLGLGVLVSDDGRVAYVGLTQAQARALEEDADIFKAPDRLLARVAADPAYRSNDLTDRVRAAVPPAAERPTPEPAASAADADEDALPVRPRRSGHRSGRPVPGAVPAGADVPAHATSDSVQHAVAELGALVTKVARLAGDQPADPATRRALQEVRRRIARLGDQVEPAADPAGPATKPQEDRARPKRARIRRLNLTPPIPLRATGRDNLTRPLKAVSDALREAARPKPATDPDRDGDSDRDRRRGWY